jgi:hypothetical protein
MKIKTGKTATMMAVVAFLAMVCFVGTVGAETSDAVQSIENIATDEAVSTDAAATTGAMDLVKMLTSQLGVTENQAAGGAGSLFAMAQGLLSESDYGQVAAAIPGIGDLIKAAPAVSESTAKQSDKMSGLTQGLGSLTKAVDSAGKYTAVYDQFKQLGLSTDMVSQFVPVILSFTESAGGESVMNILKSVWQ